MYLDKMPKVLEIKGMTQKECYTVGRGLSCHYGQTKVLLNIRLEDNQAEKLFKTRYDFYNFNSEYFIDNICLVVTHCKAEGYRRGNYIGKSDFFLVELFYTEHNTHYAIQGNKRVSIPNQCKKVLMEAKKFPNEYSGIVKINELLKEEIGVENAMFSNKYNNRYLFEKIVNLCKQNEKYGTIHVNYLPYQVQLYKDSVLKIIKVLEKAEFITITNNWIKPTKKGLDRLEKV